MHVHEREPGSGTRTLTIDPAPRGGDATREVSSTDDVQAIADELGVEMSRVRWAGGDFEHEAAAP